MNFTDEYKKRKDEFELYLNEFTRGLKDFPPELINAMSYCLLSGGKRLRPVLLLEAVRIFGGEVKSAVNFALAVECIHTYSLIHDDLPCMDNDDLRRGKPTCHKKFGETLAVLCGDALLNLAYELILGGISVQEDKTRYVKAGAEIAKAAGASGMVGGQVYDVAGCNDSHVIDEIYKKKTAALIRSALTAGAYIGGATEDDVRKISEFGELFGYCFQLKDDLLDENTEDKNTYLKLHGKQDTEKALNDNSISAVNILNTLKNSEFLKQLSLHFIKRAE